MSVVLSCLAFLFASCENKSYDSVDAIVIKTQHRHWGRGFFKVEVYYRYFDGRDTIINHATADGLVNSYSSAYKTGDSIKVEINSVDSSDSHILGRKTRSIREQNLR